MGFEFTHPARRLKCGFYVQPIHWRDDPAHDEAWADTTAAQYGGRQSPGWLREYEMKPVTGGIPVWPQLAADVHLRVFERADYMGPGWARYRSLDGGINHPTCCAWVAVNPRGDRYFYRQYYATDRTVAENCAAILAMTEPDEGIVSTIADPSLFSRTPTSGEGLNRVYEEAGLPFERADNRGAGYDAVATALVSSLARWSLASGHMHNSFGPETRPEILEVLATRPALWMHPSCADGVRSLFEECRNLHWREIRGDPMTSAAPTKPVDVNDEGPDVVRYAMQTPICYVEPERPRGIVDILKARAKARSIA